MCDDVVYKADYKQTSSVRQMLHSGHLRGCPRLLASFHMTAPVAPTLKKGRYQAFKTIPCALKMPVGSGTSKKTMVRKPIFLNYNFSL
jgi:hypothetical protein